MPGKKITNFSYSDNFTVGSFFKGTPPPEYQIKEGVFNAEVFDPENMKLPEHISAHQVKESLLISILLRSNSEPLLKKTSKLLLEKLGLNRSLSKNALQRKLLETSHVMMHLTHEQKVQVFRKLYPYVQHASGIKNAVGAFRHHHLFSRGHTLEQLLHIHLPEQTTHLHHDTLIEKMLLSVCAKTVAAIDDAPLTKDTQAVLNNGDIIPLSELNPSEKIFILKKGSHFYAFDENNMLKQYDKLPLLTVTDQSIPILQKNNDSKYVIFPYMIDPYDLFVRTFKTARYDDGRSITTHPQHIDAYIEHLKPLSDGTAALDFARIAKEKSTIFSGFDPEFHERMNGALNDYPGNNPELIPAVFQGQTSEGPSYLDTFSLNGYSLQTAITNITDAMHAHYGMHVNVKDYQSTFTLSDDKSTLTCTNTLEPVKLSNIYFLSDMDGTSRLSPNIYRDKGRILMTYDHHPALDQLTAIKSATVTQTFNASTPSFNYDIYSGEGVYFTEKFNDVFSCHAMTQALQEESFPNGQYEQLMKMGLSFENDTLEKMLTQIFKLIPDSTVSNTFLLSIKHTDVQQAFDHISSVLKPQQ